MIKPSPIFEVYQDGRALYTKNSTPGKTFFNEITVQQNSTEFREWDPRRSKLAAAIASGCKNIFVRNNSVVLYLGAAHGYTVSYLSDIVSKGFIFALDSAPRVVRDLYFVAQARNNIAPILADAAHPEQYVRGLSQVDIVYQDIAQRQQAEIFLKNMDMFLAPSGYGMIAVKARSIDVTQKPSVIFQDVRKMIDKKYPVVDFKVLEPFQKDHCFIICKKR